MKPGLSSNVRVFKNYQELIFGWFAKISALPPFKNSLSALCEIKAVHSFALIWLFSMAFIQANQAQSVTLWGLASSGGQSNAGTIMSMKEDGTDFVTEYSFSQIEGEYPGFTHHLISHNGKFYGMTTNGGNSGAGVIFEYDPAGSGSYTVKHHFDIDHGAHPFGSLLESEGKFYGMTNGGGMPGYGVIFEYDPMSGTFTVLYEFDGTLGSNPYGSLIESDQKFYGMTFSGGMDGVGVIFEYDPGMGSYQVLHHFNYTDGGNAYGSLIEKGGKFYGMTQYGGISDEGVLFEYDPVMVSYEVKFNFDQDNGKYPYGSLMESSGKFYGMTYQGGMNDNGVIFEYDLVGSVYSVKHHFASNEGQFPRGTLIESAGKFYGMTSVGGTYYKGGVLFEFNPSSGNYAVLHNFLYNTGSSPSGGLLEFGGKFYGTTTSGGNGPRGVLFEYDPAGSPEYEVKVNFGALPNGANPFGSLLESAGKFYGMTQSGGNSNYGVIFEYNPTGAGSLAVKHHFDYGNGAGPFGSLIKTGSKLYGMTGEGGSDGYGVIFEYDPVGAGLFTVIHNFVFTDGAYPQGSLIASSGKLYGMTVSGGSFDAGVIFEYDPSGSVYNIKHQFNGSNGANPSGGLIESAGKYYGVTSVGGSFNAGVIFEYDPSGSVYNIKHHFNGADGLNPTGSLIKSGGKFYGMTNGGGSNGSGVIFEYDPAGSGSFSVKHSFNSPDGGNPAGSLLEIGGTFYGMTIAGGISDMGVIFKFEPGTGTYTVLKHLDNTTGSYPYGDLIAVSEVSEPTISSFSPSSGCQGSTVIITGTHFTGATAVKIGGTDVSSFTVDSDTQITATVGSGTTGTISVATPAGTGTSAGTFTVNPLAVHNVEDNKFFCTLAEALADPQTADGETLEIQSGYVSEPCITLTKSIHLKPVGMVTLDCVILNGPGKIVIMEGNLQINSLTLTSGLIRTNGNNLKCGSITGGSASSYVVTD